MNNNITDSEIIDYWQNNTVSYTIFTDKTMHYGFWDETTKSAEEAHENTNDFIIEKLGITEDDKVLDAGCGVGGLSIYIAENCGAQVTGITISQYQIDLAQSYASNSKAQTKPQFLKQSYLDTSFPDETFTKVFGLESTCYAHDKKDFLQEAYRLLKPGGKVLLQDAFVVRNDMNPKESKHMSMFLKGWALPNLAHRDQLEQDLSEVGFKNISYYDKTDLIVKTINTVYWNAIVAYPLTWILTKLNRIDPSIHGTVKGGLAQKYIIDNGTTRYGCFVAEK